MRLLVLSQDKALVDESGVGDTLKRFMHYAKYSEKIDVLVPIRGNWRPRFVEKIAIYPCCGPRVIAWLKMYLLARRLCKHNHVDIVVTQDALMGVIGFLLKKEFGCKLNVNAFGLAIFNEIWLKQRIVHRLYKPIMCEILKRADLVRVDGRRNAELLVERLGIPGEKIVVIPIVPSPESIAGFVSAKEGKVRKRLLGKKYRHLVLYVGGLLVEKNLPSLLRAAKIVIEKNPVVLFAIVGGGPERDSLERLSKKLGIDQNVKFLGVVPYTRLPQFYAACDVYVLSSWFEGFSRTLMEAAFAGKPMVSTDVSGAGDLIEDGISGHIVKVNDHEALADRIIRLLENPRRAREMGKRAQKKVMNYCNHRRNLKKLVSAWRKLYS